MKNPAKKVTQKGKCHHEKSHATFSEMLEELRKADGFTIDEMSVFSMTPSRTIKRWIAGDCEPTEDRKKKFLEVFNGPSAPISARKMKGHNLVWDRGKRRWILRLTISDNPKLVGDRIKHALPTMNAGTAILIRDVAVALLQKLGHNVRPRIKKRKGDNR